MLHLSNPAYIYKNKFGVYYFQRRTPNSKTTIRFVRLSLHTKNRRVALISARKICVMFDELAKEYFDSAETYASAIKLLQQYRDAERTHSSSFTDFEENFLFEAYKNDDGSSPNKRNRSLLDIVFEYVEAIKISNGNDSSIAEYAKEINELKRTINNFSNHQNSNLTSINLNDSIEKFLDEQRLNWKKDSDSEQTYRNEIFSLVQELFGNIDVSTLTKEHSNKYKSAVLNYPKNRRKHKVYKNFSIHELLKLDIPDVDKLASRTKARYLGHFSAFLVWLAKSDYAKSDLNLPLQGVVSKQTQNIDNRNPYSDSDLTKLFNSDAYIRCEHDKSFKYWVPLIALLTGARENEICQLHISDIYEETINKIWVFDINENDSAITFKSLKKPYHKRLVPIHHELINLGFLDFVNFRIANNQSRLFPELEYKADRNKYATALCKWFNDTYTNRVNCNITTPKTSFHSLRHNVINFFSHRLNISENKFAYVLGQKPEGNIAVDTYIKKSELPKIVDWYKKLDFSYCVDFSKIPNWKRFRFYRNSLS